MQQTKLIQIEKISSSGRTLEEDALAVEEPLEIKIAYGKASERIQKSISITMRTPGNDFDLAIGFLYTEGIIEDKNQIQNIQHPPHFNPETRENIVLIELQEEVGIDLKKLERHFYTTSSCGVCGKTSIEALHSTHEAKLPKDYPIFSSNFISKFPDQLREKQTIFEDTGGIHAAALFNTQNELILLREDVGRHNAVDKLIGAALQADLLPLHDYLILVSGRASFELIQKSMVAEIPILAAVGAPSSLAVDLATESGMTVLGFVKKDKFNIYSFPKRIV